MAAKEAQREGLFLRNKTWHGAIRYKKADGTRGRWRGSLDTEVKSVARQRLAKRRIELEGSAPATTTPVFELVVDQYFEKHVITLKPRTQQEYACAFVLLVEEFAGREVGDIKRSDLYDLEKVLRDRNISTARQRGYFKYLSSMLTFCVENEYLEHNVMTGYLRMRSKSGLKAGQPRTRYADHNEEKRLVAAAHAYQYSGDDGRHTCRIHDAVILALDTGMRDNELKWLHRDWIDAQSGCIIIPGSSTKSGKERRVPIMPRVQKVLAKAGWHPKSGLFFWHDPETGAAYENWNKAYATVRRHAAITPHLTWHDLRRTYGCRRLQDDGLAMEEVRDLLGHSSVAVTEKHYAFLRVGSIVEKMRKKHVAA